MDGLRRLRGRLLQSVPDLATLEDLSSLAAANIWRVSLPDWPGKAIDVALISDPVVHMDIGGYVDSEEDVSDEVIARIIQAGCQRQLKAFLAIDEGEVVDRWVGDGHEFRWPSPSRQLRRALDRKSATLSYWEVRPCAVPAT